MDVAGSGVTFTGDYYTANKDATAWSPSDRDNTEELNPVYEYEDNRYVRVTPWAFLGSGSLNKYNDTQLNPDPIGQVSSEMGATTPRWFKIEPIKWIILNFNQLIVENDAIDITTDLPRLNTGIPMELYAADVLIGGIPFHSSDISTWNSGNTYTYLNDNFYTEAFSHDETKLIQPSTIYNNRALGGIVENETLPEYNSSSNHLPVDIVGMNSTSQQIYLLSRYELANDDSPYVKNGVFASGTGATSTRRASGTDYARAHNLYISSTNLAVEYWTRTAYSTSRVYRVGSSGSFLNHNYASDPYGGTRPALTMLCFAF